MIARVLALSVLYALTGPLVAGEWRLAGTLVQAGGTALVEAEGTQRLLRVNETLSDCQLQSVTAKSASFECAGRVSVLMLGASLAARAVEPAAINPDAEESVVLSRVATFEVLGDRQRLVSELPFEPLVGNSGVSGYRLLNSAPDTLVERAGFRAGDILRSVNGVTASSGQAFTQMLNNLEEARQVLIAYERDGQRLQKLILLR